MTLFGKILLLVILCIALWLIRGIRNTELPDLEEEYGVSYDENENLNYRV